LACDDLFRTLAAEMEVGAQAYRIAKAEGLEGHPLRQRIAELHADLKSEAWSKALATSDELLFTEKGGVLTRGFLRLRHDVPGLRYLAPFITTPGNIFRLGMRKSPLGTLALPHTILEAARTHDWSKVTARMAEQVIAWGVVLALMSNDPDDPWITGAHSATSSKRRGLAQRTAPSQSFTVAGHWFSYGRVEPFATMVSGVVDGIDAFRSGQPSRMTGGSPEEATARSAP